jgi:flagellar basal body rod protein FlgG
VFLNAAMSAALDRIAERAADVRRAFTPGALPQNDDVATAGESADFTLDPLSVSAPEGTYFVTTDDRGKTRYTRDSSFSVRGGALVDGSGRPVCGMREADAAPAALRVDPVDESLGRIRDARIERDGSFVYRRETIDPRSGLRESRRVVVGRVALARFPAGTRLESNDANDLNPPPGIAPQVGLPADASFAPVVPMRRERSRVGVDESLVRLKEAYIHFDALAAAEAAKSHLGKSAMDLVK